MKHLDILKNSPDPVRPKTAINLLMRPWFVVSLALHGLLLYFPIPKAPAPELPELVSLTELPPPAAIPLSTPAPASTPTRTTVPPSASPPKPAIAPSARPAPRLSIPLPSSPPIATPPTTLASPAAPTPQPASTPTPPAGSEAIATPTPTPILSPTPTVASTPNPEIPLVEGAIAGCLGSEQCWQTEETQWRSIARNLQQSLRDRGYELTEVPLSDDTGRRIYRLIKPNEAPQYLNLISTLQGTRYVFTEAPMTAEELNQAAGL